MLDMEVHEWLKQSRIKVELADVTRELATLDQPAIEAEERAKLIYEVWDKVSPINEASAEVMLARFDVDPLTEIYLIRDVATGKVIYFQPHKPSVPGLQRMDSNECVSCAADHHVKITKGRTEARIAKEVFIKLGSPQPEVL